eukprot:GHRQ01027694.1.p1 GENE.GHRQ01027694.1~~GHRQ01027694.1.p1  ORF type:complete len:280 (+),score=156.34 GHRQ01027694.1:145-984(+)
MAGDEGKQEKKDKKEKKDKDPSEKKEKKDKDSKDKKDKKDKDGDSKKDPKEKKELKHSSSDVKKSQSSSSSKTAASAGGSSKPAVSSRPPPQLKKPPKKAAPAPSDDYLAGLDLPPSEEEEEETEKRDVDKGPLVVQATDREAKKLADKERQAMEKALRMKADAMREDDNVFDVSFEGMGGDEPSASATDVKVHNLTIRAKGKVLLENTSLTIAAGRRYGLAGPNGKGKSTLLKLMARRQIPVPDNIDVLLVEQEVVGVDDQTALAAVVAADVELMELR